VLETENKARHSAGMQVMPARVPLDRNFTVLSAPQVSKRSIPLWRGKAGFSSAAGLQHGSDKRMCQGLPATER